MISIRLSEAEYNILKAHYRNFGAATVSGLARLALERILAGRPAARDAYAAQLGDLARRVDALESQVSALLRDAQGAA